jgi:uncharacterized membrane-anchored protein
MRRTLFWVFVALQALVPVALAGMKETRVAGAEHVLLRVEPVDPRDPFRGQYVALRYPIGALLPPGAPEGTTVYVPLYEAGDTWNGAYGTTSRPSGGTYLRGHVHEGRVEFGIERFYVAEHEAPRYERALAARRVYADVAVDGDGRATLRRLVIR